MILITLKNHLLSTFDQTIENSSDQILKTVCLTRICERTWSIRRRTYRFSPWPAFIRERKRGDVYPFRGKNGWKKRIPLPRRIEMTGGGVLAPLRSFHLLRSRGRRGGGEAGDSDKRNNRYPWESSRWPTLSPPWIEQREEAIKKLTGR